MYSSIILEIVSNENSLWKFEKFSEILYLHMWNKYTNVGLRIVKVVWAFEVPLALSSS